MLRGLSTIIREHFYSLNRTDERSRGTGKMLIVTSAAEGASRARQIMVHGQPYIVAEFVGQAPKRGMYQAGAETEDNGMPQGFLVRQPPGSVTPPHFHEPNQFQVFVDGSGTMGKHEAPPFTVQYANAHTPYGPICAGPEGVAYFTLRQGWDPGAKYLPANKDKLVKGNQRTRLRAGIGSGTEAERKARTGAAVETIFAPEADGLAGWTYRLGPNGTATLFDPRQGGGQYLIVGAGTLLHEGRALDRLSTVFVSVDEPPRTVVAGDDGLDLLVLQFPVKRPWPVAA